MRAVIYAAKSTADPKGSIGTQLTDCREMAEREGWTVEGEFSDEAKSAYSGSRGPGLAKAMVECERLSAEHGSTALIVQRSDRLARGDVKQARSLTEVVIWAIKNDVRLVSLMDPEMFPEGEFALLMSAVGTMKGHGESKVRGSSVKRAMEREAAKGRFMGGRAPYGFVAVGKRDDRKLEEAPAEATVVRSIFSDYLAGVSVREISRNLGWQRSAVSRILANRTYLGTQLEPAIIDREVWDRAQVIRAGHLKRKPGRHPDGGHLLVKGLLRCHCGSALKPMRARSGRSRSVYRCAGRIEHGSCSQPDVRRELIDEPLLRHLLDRYVDLEAMRQRIADRADSALVDARRTVADRLTEVAKLKRAMDTTERAWDAGDIDSRQYAKRETRLTGELAGARAALDQAQSTAESASNGPSGGDPEQELLDHLAALKAAVADGVEQAPNLNALRNVLADLFERVQLVKGDDLSPLSMYAGDGMAPLDDLPAAGEGLWLVPVLRGEGLDDELEPTPVELPAPALLGAKP